MPKCASVWTSASAVRWSSSARRAPPRARCAGRSGRQLVVALDAAATSKSDFCVSSVRLVVDEQRRLVGEALGDDVRVVVDDVDGRLVRARARGGRVGARPCCFGQLLAAARPRAGRRGRSGGAARRATRRRAGARRRAAPSTPTSSEPVSPSELASRRRARCRAKPPWSAPSVEQQAERSRRRGRSGTGSRRAARCGRPSARRARRAQRARRRRRRRRRRAAAPRPVRRRCRRPSRGRRALARKSPSAVRPRPVSSGVRWTPWARRRASLLRPPLDARRGARPEPPLLLSGSHVVGRSTCARAHLPRSPAVRVAAMLRAARLAVSGAFSRAASPPGASAPGFRR